MHTNLKILPLVITAALAWTGQAVAQSATLDVTLEVLDDVSEVDAVVLRLEDARERDEVRERNAEEARERDEFDREVRDAETERDVIEREGSTDRTERRELQNEEDDLERDFEATRERDTVVEQPAEGI